VHGDGVGAGVVGAAELGAAELGAATGALGPLHEIRTSAAVSAAAAGRMQAVMLAPTVYPFGFDVNLAYRPPLPVRFSNTWRYSFEEVSFAMRRGACVDARGRRRRVRQPWAGGVAAAVDGLVLAGQGMRSREPRRQSQLRFTPPHRSARWRDAADVRYRWGWRWGWIATSSRRSDGEASRCRDRSSVSVHSPTTVLPSDTVRSTM
jgi:hypothetical protein